MQAIPSSETLEQIHTQAWQLLQEGAQNHRSAFHTGTLVTVFNNAPQVRTVVLRGVDAQQKILCFHTDVRSPKVTQLQTCPAVSWLFYDKELRWQIRLQGTATLHMADAVAAAAWQQSRASAQMCYTTSSAPGTPLLQPELINYNQPGMQAAQLIIAKNNFCVVQTVIHTADCLLLQHTGHRRGWYNYITGQSSWLQV